VQLTLTFWICERHSDSYQPSEKDFPSMSGDPHFSGLPFHPVPQLTGSLTVATYGAIFKTSHCSFVSSSVRISLTGVEGGGIQKKA
jgi:hypothetical protein